MTFAAAGRPEDEQIGPLLEPDIACGEGHDVCFREHRHGLELEGVEGLCRQQAGFGEMSLDAAPVAFGQLMLGQGGQEPCGWPSLLVGALGEPRPHELDGRQAQFIEQEGEFSGVDSVFGGHGASPPTPASSRAS